MTPLMERARRLMGQTVIARAVVAMEYDDDNKRRAVRTRGERRGILVGLRWWQEGRYLPGSAAALGGGPWGDDLGEPPAFSMQRAVPVFLISPDVHRRPFAALVEDVVGLSDLVTRRHRVEFAAALTEITAEIAATTDPERARSWVVVKPAATAGVVAP